MKNSTYLECKEFPFQASIPCLVVHVKDEITAVLRTPGIVPQKPPEKLTDEATYMICVLLIFCVLAVLGTLVTLYELFFKGTEAKSKYIRNSSYKSVAERKGKEKKSSEKLAWFEDFTSFLKCFCLVKNGSKILNTGSAEGQIDCIQGLRFLTNLTVLAIHSGLAFLSITRDLEAMRPISELRAGQIFLSGMSIVNVFFVISGYLNAYSFFHKYSKSNGNISWFQFYFKRFMRLTPVYMIILGFYTTLFSYTGSGYVWPSYSTNPICKKNWWWNLLYINNLGQPSGECMPWCWYLASDMQFYIISPLYMISLLRWPLLGYALLTASIAGSTIIAFLLTIQYNLIDGFARFEFHIPEIKYLMIKFWELFDIEYSKPYTRINTYLVGILLAYYLYRKQISKNTIKNNRVTLCCGWIVTAILIWLCIFSLYRREEIIMETALFNSTKNLFFSCCSAWVLYLCITKQSKFLTKCLSWKYFLPLSRLSYCAYLIHPIIMAKMILQSGDLLDFSIMNALYFFVHLVVVTYAFSFITALLFEIPVMNVLDWFGKPKRKENSTKNHCD